MLELLQTYESELGHAVVLQEVDDSDSRPFLEDARFTVYEDEGDANVNVSICGLQSQPNKGKMSQITDKSHETHNSHGE